MGPFKRWHISFTFQSEQNTTHNYLIISAINYQKTSKTTYITLKIDARGQKPHVNCSMKIKEIMEKFIPKTVLDWIWTTGVIVLIGLVIFTLITGVSPFELLGLAPKTTTIIFGALVVTGVATPYILRKIRQ
jgi:hypothetical protein